MGSPEPDMVYQWLDQRVTHEYDPQRLGVVGDSDPQTQIREKSCHGYPQWVTHTGYPGRLGLMDRLGPP
jgi:hypothetical protein